MNYQKLIVWQKSMALVTHIYVVIRQLPREELFALSSQIRRAAVSIPANIAEGSSRLSRHENKYFLGVARGSAAELETHLLICQSLNYLPQNEVLHFLECLQEIERMLTGLMRKL